MFDWFWNWGPMARIQGVVDETCAGAPEPLTLITIAVIAALVIIWRLTATRAERPPPIPGETYLGKITPKTLNRMTRNNRVQKPKTREEIERAIKSRKRR